MCVGAMTLFAVSCYDDSALREDLAGLEDEVAGLAARLDSLENVLNDDVKNLNELESAMTDLEEALTDALKESGVDLKKAFEDELAGLEKELAAAIAKGDQANADALAAEIKKIEEAMATLETTLNGKLEEGLTSVTTSLEELRATVTSLETLLGQKYEEILGKMDAADGILDGKIADLATALEQVKKDYASADAAVSADVAAKIAEAIAKIAVTNVETVGDKVVLTLATGDKVELSKPLENVDNNGLVTIMEDENGARFWAVIVNGEPQSLNIMVGSDVQLEFRVQDNVLEYTTNGTDWTKTGAYVADDAENLLSGFYQGETGDFVYDEDWNAIPVLEDFYTLVYGGTEYYLPIYRVDNSTVTIKAGKTYFAYGESKTIDVAVNDVTAMYVMTKPDGWKAVLDGKKLTVTAPAEANVTSGVAEADGEVLLHCSTVEGKCKIARLAVATTEGFSLTVDAEGNVKIVNPVVVTTTDMWGNENTDFNDAYVGLAPIADFEADPVTYVNNIQENNDALFYYLNNWKMNTAESDPETWEMIYTIGGAYVPGTYEVDVIETTVPKMYADWRYGKEMPRGSQFVVWACPMDDKGMPNIDELVYAYYTPIETVAELSDTSFNELTVKVALYGSKEYIVGKVDAEYTFNWNTEEYDLAYYLNDGLNGLAYGYNNLGMTVTESGEFEYALSKVVNDREEAVPLAPGHTYFFYILPVIDGKEWADYTAADFVTYEFKTKALTAGGTAKVSFANEVLTYTEIAVDLTGSEGTTMIYYNFFDAEAEYTAADLITEGYITNAMSTTARDINLTPNTSRILAAVAVDAEGKYGELVEEEYTTPEIAYSTTFKATIGTPEVTSFEKYGSTYYEAAIPVTVEGGTAAKYYYYWNTTVKTIDELKSKLPLGVYPCTAAEILPEKFNCSTFYAPFQLVVVVESTEGELSEPVEIMVNKPTE